MSDQDGATSSESTESSGRGRSRRPIWRRGWFWVAVIGVEVALALVVSFALERSRDEVDLAGGDLVAFCEQARTIRAAAVPAAGESTAVDDPAPFIAQRDAYLALVATAPPDLVHDLERLAELNAQIIVTTGEIAEKKAADPAYDGGFTVMAAELDRVGIQGQVSAARVDLVLEEQCGIALDEPPTTTSTAGPLVTVPGTAPS